MKTTRERLVDRAGYMGDYRTLANFILDAMEFYADPDRLAETIDSRVRAVVAESICAGNHTTGDPTPYYGGSGGGPRTSSSTGSPAGCECANVEAESDKPVGSPFTLADLHGWDNVRVAKEAHERYDHRDGHWGSAVGAAIRDDCSVKNLSDEPFQRAVLATFATDYRAGGQPLIPPLPAAPQGETLTIGQRMAAEAVTEGDDRTVAIRSPALLDGSPSWSVLVDRMMRPSVVRFTIAALIDRAVGEAVGQRDGEWSDAIRFACPHWSGRVTPVTAEHVIKRALIVAAEAERVACALLADGESTYTCGQKLYGEGRADAGSKIAKDIRGRE